eukprot:UN12364
MTSLITIFAALSRIINAQTCGRSRDYIYVEKLMTAVEAEQYCVDIYGTHLATVETWADNRYIRDTCNPPGAYELRGCPPQGADPIDALPENILFNWNCACWIGLQSTDPGIDNSRSTWEWTDGTTVYDYEDGSFENWVGAVAAPPIFTQPNDFFGQIDQSCTSVFKGAALLAGYVAADGNWNDRHCDS